MRASTLRGTLQGIDSREQIPIEDLNQTTKLVLIRAFHIHLLQEMRPKQRLMYLSSKFLQLNVVKLEIYTSRYSLVSSVRSCPYTVPSFVPRPTFEMLRRKTPQKCQTREVFE